MAIATPRVGFTDPVQTTTMAAVTQEKYGSTDVLEYRTTVLPKVGDDQVLVRVQAAGVNPADWAITAGLPYIARPMYGGLRKPKNAVRGTDVAGVIEAVGTSVARLHAGDAVFGWCAGSFAEYAAIDEAALVLMPTNVSFEQAAAVPLAGCVALQAIRDKGNVHTDQKVLINGASGGVGTLAVQIAKLLGARVTGVCSARNLDLVRSIGADDVIDYEVDTFTRQSERYDFILDNIGNYSLSDLRGTLTRTGTLVPNSGGFDQHWFASGGRVMKAFVVSRFVSQTLRPFVSTPKYQDLMQLKELMETGHLAPVIDRTYSLLEAAAAVAYVGCGHTRGKVVISI